MDPVLLDIFAKETSGHLQVIKDYLEACEGHTPPFQVTDKLYRACHTLHGSANMANVDRGVAVAGALNRFVRRVYDYKIGFQKSGTDALRAAAKAIASIVGEVNKPIQKRMDFAVLIEHISNLTNAVQPESDQIVTAPAPVELDPVPEQVEEAEYDAEIAAIFSEEAAELLEAADAALGHWSNDKDSKEYVEELMRHLHTLKGGARMSGILAMGDLSHEIEALLINIDGGRIEFSKTIEDTLQHSIDELHRMRDTVIAGKKVVAALDLERRIQQINADEAQPADTTPIDVAADAIDDDDLDTSDSVSVEFTAEPEESVSMVIIDSPVNDEMEEIRLANEAAEKRASEPPVAAI